MSTFRSPELPARFWDKVAADSSGCWNWTGYLTVKGYGRFNAGGRHGRILYAHRVAYAALVGPVPPGLEIDHLCRNRACVNPAHMESVTHAENVRRALMKGECRRGHSMTGDNVRYTQSEGRLSRYCRACNIITARQWREARRAER